jgi:hypothetical protein
MALTREDDLRLSIRMGLSKGLRLVRGLRRQLDEDERRRPRSPCTAAAERDHGLDRMEIRPAFLVERSDFAVDHRGPAAKLTGGLDDRTIVVRPVEPGCEPSRRPSVAPRPAKVAWDMPPRPSGGNWRHRAPTKSANKAPCSCGKEGWRSRLEARVALLEQQEEGIKGRQSEPQRIPRAVCQILPEPWVAIA